MRVPVSSSTEMACRGGPSCVVGTVIWWYSQTGVPNKVGVVVEGGVPIELFAVAY